MDFIMLRPRGIFGAGDTSVLPRILKMAERGFFVLANPKAVVDITYIDNLIQALLLCINVDKNAYGKIFNISNAENLTIQELLKALFEKLDMKVRFIKVPFFVLYAYAAVLEFVAKHFIKNEPRLTRYSVGIISKSLTLNIDSARRDLGYEPEFTINEGLDKYVESIRKEDLCKI
jgi:nucleoside-diphosphate-sugar epimerase